MKSSHLFGCIREVIINNEKLQFFESEDRLLKGCPEGETCSDPENRWASLHRMFIIEILLSPGVSKVHASMISILPSAFASMGLRPRTVMKVLIVTYIIVRYRCYFQPIPLYLLKGVWFIWGLQIGLQLTPIRWTIHRYVIFPADCKCAYIITLAQPGDVKCLYGGNGW